MDYLVDQCWAMGHGYRLVSISPAMYQVKCASPTPSLLPCGATCVRPIQSQKHRALSISCHRGLTEVSMAIHGLWPSHRAAHRYDQPLHSLITPCASQQGLVVLFCLLARSGHSHSPTNSPVPHHSLTRSCYASRQGLVDCYDYWHDFYDEAGIRREPTAAFTEQEKVECYEERR